MKGILGVSRRERKQETERGREREESEGERDLKRTWKPFKDFNQGRYTGRLAV